MMIVLFSISTEVDPNLNDLLGYLLDNYISNDSKFQP